MSEWIRLTPGTLPNTSIRVYRHQPDREMMKHAFGAGWYPDELNGDCYVNRCIECTDHEALSFALLLPEVRALVEGMRRAEQTVRNLGNGFLTGDLRQIALNEAANIRADLAPFLALEV